MAISARTSSSLVVNGSEEIVDGFTEFIQEWLTNLLADQDVVGSNVGLASIEPLLPREL